MPQLLRVPVRELVEYALQAGDISSGGFASARQQQERMLEGTRGHAEVRRAFTALDTPDAPCWRWEVVVESTVTDPQTGTILQLNGRIDGLYEKDDEVQLLEIKTIERLTGIEQQGHPLHWGQAELYASMLNDPRPIKIILCYYHLKSGERYTLSRMLSPRDREDFFIHCTDLYLRRARLQSQWQRLRDDSLRELPFPFGAFRAGQRQLAGETFRTLRRGAQGNIAETAQDKVLEEMEGERKCAQLFTSAPTGIGKTMAALYPALKAMGEGYCARLFYLTARTIARTVAEEALAKMREQGLMCKGVTLTARDKICFMETALCDPDFCPYAKGYYDRVRDALEDAFSLESSFTRTNVETFARKHTVCPFEFQLDLSLWCDVIVCDYNYLFDPTVYLRRFFQESTGDHGFLIDEAHNLVDRGREMYSAQLSGQEVSDTCKSLRARQKLEKGRKDKLTVRAMTKALGQVDKWCRTMSAQWAAQSPDGQVADAEKPKTLLPLLDAFTLKAEEWLAGIQEVPGVFSDPDMLALQETVLNMFFSALGFLRTSEFYDERYVTLGWREYGYAQVKLWCMDPSKPLAACMEKGSAAILFSATLTPLSYFHRLLGGHGRARQLSLASPFPPEHLCVLVHRGISTRYRDREASMAQVADAIGRMASAHRGNYLAFFPSHRYMQDVYAAFVAQFPNIDVQVQQNDMDESARQAFLDAFESETDRTMLGFAVMGGIFGEGIDLVGDRLCGVAIVGVGLPQICLEREVIKEYFDLQENDMSDDGYAFAYRFPGMNKVLQAVGRVIRSETDRGVALLIDDRFMQPVYRRLFPEHWQPKMLKQNDEITRLMQGFWRIGTE